MSLAVRIGSGNERDPRSSDRYGQTGPGEGPLVDLLDGALADMAIGNQVLREPLPSDPHRGLLGPERYITYHIDCGNCRTWIGPRRTLDAVQSAQMTTVGGWGSAPSAIALRRDSPPATVGDPSAVVLIPAIMIELCSLFRRSWTGSALHSGASRRRPAVPGHPGAGRGLTSGLPRI